MTGRIHRVAQQILDQLDPLSRWTVVGVEAEVDQVRVEVQGRDAERGLRASVAVFYPVVVSQQEAVIEIASQLQDHVVESDLQRGEPVPLCPGHVHPTIPLVIGDRAVWACPRTGDALGHIDG